MPKRLTCGHTAKPLLVALSTAPAGAAAAVSTSAEASAFSDAEAGNQVPEPASCSSKPAQTASAEPGHSLAGARPGHAEMFASCRLPGASKGGAKETVAERAPAVAPPPARAEA